MANDPSAQLGGALDPNGQFIGRDKGGDIASASPLVVDTDGDYFDVTGTTGFSAMTVAANRSFVLQFDGILTITVGAGITLNNGGSNYTTAAGDIIVCQSTAANTVTGWIIKAEGTALVGGLEFVTTAAITLATTITVTGLAAGYDYIFVLEAFAPTTDAETLWMRWSDDGGSTYEADAADYQWDVQRQGIDEADASDSEIQLVGTVSVGNDANNTSTMEVTLINPNAGSEQTTAFWNGFIMNIAATPDLFQIVGAARFIQGVDAVDAVQFLWSGGSTFKAQGDITVWRRRRS